MKAGHILFLAAAFFALAGTSQIQAESINVSNQTLGAVSLERFDFATNTIPSKFDLTVPTDSSQVLPCIPLESNSPVCSSIHVPLCTLKPSEGETIKTQALTAVPETPKPTIAEAPEVVTDQTPELTPAPTMSPLKDEYAPRDAVLNSDKIFDIVNQYRTSRGLSPFERDDKVCELAQTRSSEIIAEIENGTLHSGLYNRPLPYWIFENAKYGSNEEGTVAWWLASPIHHHSIVSDYKYSCVKCTGSYCTELFTSFSPKQLPIAEPTP